MKKIFKVLSILAATTALTAGIATATACSAGYNGVYEGEYSYNNAYGGTYGMRVEVTVENNIITKVRDITNTDLAKQGDKEWTVCSPSGINPYWDDSSVKNWKDNKAWLLQQYEGKSVAEILDLKVYTAYGYSQVDGKWVEDDTKMGQPYGVDKNNGFSEYLISNSTQGSGRLLLAVQNALSKK